MIHFKWIVGISYLTTMFYITPILVNACKSGALCSQVHVTPTNITCILSADRILCQQPTDCSYTKIATSAGRKPSPQVHIKESPCQQLLPDTGIGTIIPTYPLSPSTFFFYNFSCAKPTKFASIISIIIVSKYAFDGKMTCLAIMGRWR